MPLAASNDYNILRSTKYTRGHAHSSQAMAFGVRVIIIGRERIDEKPETTAMLKNPHNVSCEFGPSPVAI